MGINWSWGGSGWNTHASWTAVSPVLQTARKYAVMPIITRLHSLPVSNCRVSSSSLRALCGLSLSTVIKPLLTCPPHSRTRFPSPHALVFKNMPEHAKRQLNAACLSISREPYQDRKGGVPPVPRAPPPVGQPQDPGAGCRHPSQSRRQRSLPLPSFSLSLCYYPPPLTLLSRAPLHLTLAARRRQQDEDCAGGRSSAPHRPPPLFARLGPYPGRRSCSQSLGMPQSYRPL